jgi:hypothetical protein
MKVTVSALLAAVVALIPSIVSAQESPERLGDALAVGSYVSVVDAEGQRREGRVTDSADGLVKMSRRGHRFDVPLERIVLVEKPDSVRNGALTGLVAGLTLGALTLVVFADGELPAGFAVTNIVTNGLFWMGVGTGLDALFDNRRTLYARGPSTRVRVQPIVKREGAGLSVGIQW